MTTRALADPRGAVVLVALLALIELYEGGVDRVLVDALSELRTVSEKRVRVLTMAS